jgi:hypothetical protein
MTEWQTIYEFINIDKLVKSSLLRHSRAGGNDEMAKYLSFYETININM